jgi:hypothetical protein
MLLNKHKFYNYKTWNTSTGANITLKYMCTKFMTAELEQVPEEIKLTM